MLPPARAPAVHQKGGFNMQIARDIFYVGVDDHDIDLFEGMYEVPNGMAYNSIPNI